VTETYDAQRLYQGRRPHHRGAGTIINVASLVGIGEEALHDVDSASKSYLLSFG
jgi:short-subunit dehydrogenase